MIEVRELTKKFGERTAVDGISFRLEPGTVTGFIGPNGAGKTTTMRMMTGLDRPTSGVCLIDGRRYQELAAPVREVGTLIDPDAVHPGRTARNHLRMLGRTHRIPDRRADEVLELAGLGGVADRRVRTFSLGMRQRLGLAAALLGDPRAVLLDEPANGLDPDGVIWVRSFLRSLAREGRVVFLSSHLMDELARTVDRLIVLSAGRIVADAGVRELIDRFGGRVVRVRPDRPAEVDALLRGHGLTVTEVSADTLEIAGADASRVATLAAANGNLLYEVADVSASLEDAYLALTAHHPEVTK